VRQALTATPATLPDYRIEQDGMAWRIAVADESDASWAALAAALERLAARHGLAPPRCVRMPFAAAEAHVKRRRIRCLRRPDAEPERAHA
jgi:hypothetical protein